MKAWVLGDPNEPMLIDKPIVMPGKAEFLVKIDAVAICATDLPIALKYARERIDDVIKIGIKPWS